jgi:hypothetical protein
VSSLPPHPGVATIPLLLEDPELGAGIEAGERVHAERLLQVPGFAAGIGPLRPPPGAEGVLLGLLVLEGLVTVNVCLVDRVASTLAGPGDVLEPGLADEIFVPARVDHHVSASARFAVLDEHVVAAARRWPALLLALHDRRRSQERRLMLVGAIGKLRRVDARVLAILWHLAERWGRVTPDGVALPLALTHETIGRLAGAERPTVSLALTELAESGEVVLRADGAFLLDPRSLERLAPGGAAAPQLRALQRRGPHG